jgi:PAS domain S-box-containing protein
MDRQISELKAEVTRLRKLTTDPKGPENLYREALTESPFGILVHDSEGKILLFNSRLVQITGYAADEIPDIPTWFRLIYPNEDYRKIVLTEPRHEAPHGATRVRESMITCRDGRKSISRFTSVRLESGLRIVFIQPAEDSAALFGSQAESEYGSRLLFHNSLLPTLLWIRQADDFILVSYNAAAQNLLGNQLAVSLGQPQTDLFASYPEVFDCMQFCLTENRTLHTEFWTATDNKDSDKYLRLTFIYGAPALVTVHVEDLTRIKQAEDEIVSKEERFQELVNLLPETVYEMDPSGRIFFLNHNGYERFGVTPEDIERGFYPVELLIPEDRARARQNVARMLAGNYSGPNEYTAILKDGRKVSHLASSRPIVQHGLIVGSRGIIVDTTERKQMEAALRDNEERLRLAVEAAQIGIYTTDFETNSRQWSPEMYAIAGRPPGTIKTYEEAWSIVHPGDRARVFETHRRALDPVGDGFFYSEHRIVRPNGDVRLLTWQGCTFFRETASGRVPTRRLGACIDITERKRAEIALQESETKFSKMFNVSPHGLAITTLDEGRYLEANPLESVLTGYTRKELIGRTAIELGFYDDPKDSQEIRQLLTMNGTVNNYKFRFRRKSGEILWGLLSASLIEFEGKKCLLSTVSDISDLHKVEEALKLSEARLRMATEGASVGLWDWNIRSDSAVCNEIFYSMLGYYPQEFTLSLESWKHLVHPDDRESAIRNFNQALAGNQPTFTAEYRIKCKDGTWRWILDIGRVFERDADGRAARAIGIHTDIHDRKISEEALFRSNKDLEERVRSRTVALEELNESLRSEISARRKVEDQLRGRTEELAEINNALRVILRKSREESEENVSKIVASIRQMAFPHLEKLKLARLTGRQAAYLQLLEETLSEITSSDLSSLSGIQRNLTPSEYQVAALIRQGKSSKQISEIMSLSCRTIESHRKSIRKKLGLHHSKTNLRNYLASIGNNR